MSRTPAAAPPALALLVVVLLGACTADTSDDAAPRSGSASASGTPSASASGNPSATPSASASASDSSPAGSTPVCTTADLLVTVKAAPGGAAGATHQELGFSNETDHACTISGYPEVTYVARGRQVGAAADHDASVAPPTLTLQTGDVATAAFTIADPALSPGCRLTDVTKLRIVPPGQTKAVAMRIQAAGCADPDVHLLTVGPLL